MSNFQVSQIIHTLISASDILFRGLKVLISLLVLLSIFKASRQRLSIPRLFRASNFTILVASLLFLSAFIMDNFIKWRNGDEAELEFMLSVLRGSHWYQFVLPVVSYAVIPQVLWIKKFRNSSYSSVIIISFWFLIYFLILYLNQQGLQGLQHHATTIPAQIWEYAWKGLIAAIMTALIARLQSGNKKSHV